MANNHKKSIFIFHQYMSEIRPIAMEILIPPNFVDLAKADDYLFQMRVENRQDPEDKLSCKAGISTPLKLVVKHV